MRYQLYSQKQTKLIVYFAGWGTPLQAVAHLECPQDFDLLICYDYRTLELDFDFSPYQEIHLVAWSLGVWAAERAMQGITLCSSTAINGTGLPKSDELGIPHAIFEGTLASLNEENRRKFERRMCNKADLLTYQAFESRPLDEITQELEVLNALISAHPIHRLIRWDRAIIGRKDKIFVAQNQQAYWQSVDVPTVLVEGEHYLFLAFSSWLDILNIKEILCK